MDDAYTRYLDLLEELCRHLASLCETARQKTDAVRRDDLLALDQVLKREQAQALSLRGLEQKRLGLLADMGLSDLPLRELPGRYPPALRLRARQTADRLQQQYQVYRTAAEVARNTLELNLHEIEKLLAAWGAPDPAGAGYTRPDAEPPAGMKTDIRA